MLALLLSNPVTLLLLLPILLLSLTLHEVSHGYAAMKCGDNTAKNMGRLTLDPLAHLDLRGTLMMLIVGFGWAKPVPVNPRNFKNPKRDIAIVAIAGPLANIIVCFASVVVYYICLHLFGLTEGLDLVEFLSPGTSILMCDQVYLFQELLPEFTNADIAPTLQCILLQVFSLSATLNAGLAVFNLIPIPPLDGSRIITSLLPQKAAVMYLKLERYIIYMLLAVMVLNILGSYVPLLGTVSDYIFYPITFCRQGLLKLFESLMQLIPR